MPRQAFLLVNMPAFAGHTTGRADLSGSSAIAGFRPHRSHRAALPQWALQKGPEAGRSSGRFVHTREVRLQGLPALCLALRLPRRDPFLPLPFLHRLVSFGDFIDVGSEEARLVAFALTSVRRSNWTCSFPASSFHEWAFAV